MHGKAILLALCTTLAVNVSLQAQQKEVVNPTEPTQTEQASEAHPMSYWMMKKTQVSQAIFAELAKGDMERVAKLSDELTFLNKVEGFVRTKIPGYSGHLQVFQFANQELGRQARKENVEGAALAFHQMTISCVSCHKLLREQR